ncbi:unnamed protein product, partial [Prorocentrum cordatum]
AFQSVTHSWVLTMPDHPYLSGLKQNLANFVEELTAYISMVDSKISNEHFDAMADYEAGKIKDYEQRWATMKAEVAPFIQHATSSSSSSVRAQPPVAHGASEDEIDEDALFARKKRRRCCKKMTPS